MTSFLSPEARAGLRDIAPALIACVPIALLYGALAAGKGMSAAEVALMSAMVFAGGAQFAAVEIWRTPAPLLLLAFTVLLINARHVLMGASLTPKTGVFKPWQRFLGFAIMADENWAMAERRAAAHPLTATYWFAMSVVFWANWLICSVLGALAGSFLGDPRELGADFAFTAIFIGLIAGFCKTRRAALTVATAAAGSAAAHLTVGAPWHVAAGALAGILASYAAANPEAIA
jgi:4-azaleucine resistance transporter AzlC